MAKAGNGRMGCEEEDDDRPSLSLHTLEALKEFLAEQGEQQRKMTSHHHVSSFKGEDDDSLAEPSLLSEDWRLSQFWYEKETAETVAEELIRLSKEALSPIACIACPTLYAYLKKMDPSVRVQLLEYDKRFEQYGSDFTFYDYNQPEDLPVALKHAFSIIVADPPYLSKECLEKVAQTLNFLAEPVGSYALLLTGEVQRERAEELLNMYPCGFRPKHSSKLGNDFMLFTNYDPVDRLGGWLKTSYSQL
ncbi:uncharacterized protein LOC116267603 [Nymphaea colorata]|nr:uncharacterized protein LOC116267603 [Nymphaea colorata]